MGASSWCIISLSDSLFKPKFSEYPSITLREAIAAVFSCSLISGFIVDSCLTAGWNWSRIFSIAHSGSIFLVL